MTKMKRIKSTKSVKDVTNYAIRKRQMSEAFAHFVTRGLYQVTRPNQNSYLGLPPTKVCREFLMITLGEEARNMGAGLIYNKLQESYASRKENRSIGPFAAVSDFANFFDLNMQLSLVASYTAERSKQTFVDWIATNEYDDFKEVKKVHLGELGPMELFDSDRPEGAEYPVKEAPEAYEETFKLNSYGMIFQMTRQAFVNDSLKELDKVFKGAAAAAALESDLVYRELTDGTLGGSDVFSTTNGNLTSGAPLSRNMTTNVANLNGFAAMMTGLKTRTDLGGSTPLNMNLGHVVLPAALCENALLAVKQLFPDNPESFGSGVEHPKLHCEARLDADSNSSYYGIAAGAGNARPFIELAFLKGKRKPQIMIEESMGNDVLMYKVRHDVAAKVVDFRPAHKCTV